jgi:hypothetical protein
LADSGEVSTVFIENPSVDDELASWLAKYDIALHTVKKQMTIPDQFRLSTGFALLSSSLCEPTIDATLNELRCVKFKSSVNGIKAALRQWLCLPRHQFAVLGVVG